MSTSNKQEIDRITNSTINQAGGDVYVIKGVSAVEVVQICNDIMRAQMSIYTQQANESAQKRLDSFCKKFTTRLTKVEEIISKQLKEPSIQIALYESIKGSIDGNNDELTDELIDLMIDRMSIPERCSKQFIIDAARRVLPKLTQSHIAFLALKVFSDLKLGGNSEVVSEILFSKLEQLLVNCTTISDLDIDYLSQVGCFGNPKMLINKRSIESILLSIYDLLLGPPLVADYQLQFEYDQRATQEREDKCPVYSCYVYEFNSNRLNYGTMQRPYCLVTTAGGTLDGVTYQPITMPMRITQYLGETATEPSILLRNHIYRFEIVGLHQDIQVNWTVCPMTNIPVNIDFN